MAPWSDFMSAADLEVIGDDVSALLGDAELTEQVQYVHAVANDPIGYDAFKGTHTHSETADDNVAVIIGSRRDSAPSDVVVGRYRVLVRAGDLSRDPDTNDTLVRSNNEVLQVNAVVEDPVLSSLGVWVLEVTSVES